MDPVKKKEGSSSLPDNVNRVMVQLLQAVPTADAHASRQITSSSAPGLSSWIDVKARKIDLTSKY